MLMGKRQLNGQATMEVLSYFGETPIVAMQRYEAFVTQAASAGHREEFAGGGMYRSSSFLHTQPGKEAFDERVFGSGQFVEEMWSEQADTHESLPTLESVLQAVADHYSISLEQLCNSNKERRIAQARALACFVAERLLGYSGVCIAHVLKITPSAVTVAAKRGEMLADRVDNEEFLKNIKITATSPRRGDGGRSRE